MCEDAAIDSIGHEIKAINHLMHRKMMNWADSSGIDRVTLMHGWIIGYLSKNEGRDVFQKDIESQFAISRSSVTGIVKSMEQKGYISRESVDSDARLKKLVLTDEGRRLSEKIHNYILQNEQRYDSLLSAQERETFMALLKKLRNSIEAI